MYKYLLLLSILILGNITVKFAYASNHTIPNPNRILIAQQKDYDQNATIKIADPRIKEISIQDNHEKLIDLSDPMINPRESKIKLMPSKENSHHGFYHAPHPDCFKVRVGLYQALQKLVLNLPKNVGIYIYEAYRPISVQQQYFDKVYNEIKKENPSFTEKEIFDKTSALVSPIVNNVPPHSTGGAVDITLININTFIPLDMGKFGAIFGPNPVAGTYAKDITKIQQKNRQLLLQAAAKAGLVNYPLEWWHYSTGDRYAAYWLKQKHAIYGIAK